MTAQASDIVLLKGEQYNLVAYSTGLPFNPVEYGYKPVAASSACWRGFLCEYKIETGVFLLDKLHINHQETDIPVSQKKQPHDLHGSIASVSKTSFIGRWLFENVAMPVEYSGGLIKLWRDIAIWKKVYQS